MRLIDGDALKEAFYQEMKELLKSTDTPKISNEALSLLCGASLITKAHTIEPKPHWIPCSERLPEEEGQYLVTKSRAGKKSVEFAIYFEIYEWNTADPVVAWMPLPEPWKEG